MNKFPTESQIKNLRECYPEGTRIKLHFMDDPYSPIPAGMTGTVSCVDDAGNIHMKWDNGRTLALIAGVDSFEKIPDKRGNAQGNTAEFSEM